jgi:4-amino-4-deoxy-L-arabinose transferase-like glycosyltransferase
MLSLSRTIKRNPREWAILFFITLIAAFFRLYRLTEIPPGMHYDEAFYAFDVLRLLQGQFAIFFPANNGREPLYIYLAMVAVANLGAQAIALRLTSAIIGIATIPLIYGFARALFSPSLSQGEGRGEGSSRIAALAALFSAISVWHIYYSRYGLRVILAIPLAILALWFSWRALKRRNLLRDYALAGLFTALTTYTYLSGRLLPLILIALTFSAILLDRRQAANYLKGLGVTGVVAFALFLPLGLYFVMNPEQFTAHSANLSIFDPRVGGGDVVGAAWSNLGAVAGMFFIRGDHALFRNVAHRPVFDPFVAILFVIGVGILLHALLAPRVARQERLRAILLAVCLVVFLGTSVLSDDPPNFTRTLNAAPFVMMLPAWAVVFLWDRFRILSRFRVLSPPFALSLPFAFSRALVLLIFGGIVAISALLTFRDYFITFANDPALYLAFDVEKIDAANWINANARANHIYLAPLWYQQGTLSLLTRNAPLKSFESRDTVVLPSRAENKDALYAFPNEQERKANKLAERLGSLAAREAVIGSTGAQILIVYRVRANDLPAQSDPLAALSRGGDFIQPQKIARAVWGDQLELFGYTLSPEGPGGRNLTVTLFLRARNAMNEDYTFSIKARDEKDRVWGQEDKWLGSNSYATTQMSAGDLVVEKFYPGLNACAPAGDYRVTVEAYNPKTGAVLGLSDREGNAVALGTLRAGASEGNRLEDLEPAQSVDLSIAPQMQLIGVTLTPNDLRAGDPFSLALFWRGQGDGALQRGAAIRLRDSSRRDFTLAEKQIAFPPEGRGLCTLFDLQTPREVAPGAGALFVNDVKIANVNFQMR